MLVHELLESSARERPEALALLAGTGATTYGELDALATQFARVCVREGVRPGDRVAIALENSIELIACYFGAMKAGGVAVPLPPGARSDRFSRAIADCRPALSVVDEATFTSHRTQLAGSRVLVHDGERAALSGEGTPRDMLLSAALTSSSAAPFPAARRPHDLAAIIYTSGSMSQPRGVMLTHQNILANTRSIVAYLTLTPADRVMCVLPLYYAYGLSLLHTHVLIGGTVILENRVAFPSIVLETMASQGATGFAGVPSTFALLLRRSSLRTARLPHLRYVTQAGAAMPPTLLREWLAALPDVPFFVMYGATEASARLTYLPPADIRRKVGSIGRAVSGVEIDVVTDGGTIAACGEVGELVARGANISAGYWNDETATEQRFGINGFRTGDLGYRDTEGFLFIVGRRHDMLKIGGQRVAPQEIEHVLQQHPAVSEAVVVGAADELLGERPVAFLVLREGMAADEASLRRFCAGHLAAAKVPYRVEFYRDLPRLGAGKVDRQLLRRAAASCVAPRDSAGVRFRPRHTCFSGA